MHSTPVSLSTAAGTSTRPAAAAAATPSPGAYSRMRAAGKSRSRSKSCGGWGVKGYWGGGRGCLGAGLDFRGAHLPTTGCLHRSAPPGVCTQPHPPAAAPCPASPPPGRAPDPDAPAWSRVGWGGWARTGQGRARLRASADSPGSRKPALRPHLHPATRPPTCTKSVTTAVSGGSARPSAPTSCTSAGRQATGACSGSTQSGCRLACAFRTPPTARHQQASWPRHAPSSRRQPSQGPLTRQRDQLCALHAAARAQPGLQAASVGRNPQHLRRGAVGGQMCGMAVQGPGCSPAAAMEASLRFSRLKTIAPSPRLVYPPTWRRWGVMSSAVSPVSTINEKGPRPPTRSCSRT